MHPGDVVPDGAVRRCDRDSATRRWSRVTWAGVAAVRWWST